MALTSAITHAMHSPHPLQKIALNFRDSKGNTLLHLAAQKGDLEGIDFLCNEVGVVKHATNKYGDTPLHYAAWYGQFKALRALIEEQGMDVHRKNKQDETALHFAGERGHVAIVRYLLRNYHMNALDKSKSGYNPCELAASRKRQRTVSAFIQDSGKKARLDQGPGGYCPVCIEYVPKNLYTVSSYECLHFLCADCKKDMQKTKGARCPICRHDLK